MGAIVLAVAGALALIWRFTPLRDIATPAAVGKFLVAYRTSPLAPEVTVAAFVLGGLVAFPVTIMILATTATFGIWPGLLYAALGSVASAAAGYAVGRAIGADRMERLFGHRVATLKPAAKREGVVAVMALRILPIAPFTLINLGGGALGLRFLDYMAGTVLGLAPGLVVLALAGGRVSAFINSPSGADAAWFALAIVIWMALSAVLQMVLHRFHGES
jgi:phospholipase D1/2